jgi:hypothetical protein
MLPDMGGMPSQGAPAAGPVPVAPPPSSPDALSGVDPSVLAMLSSRMGMQLPNTM